MRLHIEGRLEDEDGQENVEDQILQTPNAVNQ